MPVGSRRTHCPERAIDRVVLLGLGRERPLRVGRAAYYGSVRGAWPQRARQDERFGSPRPGVVRGSTRWGRSLAWGLSLSLSLVGLSACRGGSSP